jgi:hypothetical protein
LNGGVVDRAWSVAKQASVNISANELPFYLPTYINTH